METLKFSVDSALLSEIGERLVESAHIALLELVKNSYDADATEVVVEIQLADDEFFDIVISDNGSGMSFADVQSYWMRIATTHKLDDDITNLYGRPKSGSKGIGRFSCRRLGTQLSLSSTAKVGGKYETTKLEINWLDYKRGTDLDSIKCKGVRATSVSGETGTTLTISECPADQWTSRGWKVLKRRLVLLVTNRGGKRRGFERDPGFNVKLIAPEFEDSDIVDPRMQLMDAGWGTLTLKIDKAGKANWTLVAKKIGEKTVTLAETYTQLAGTTAEIAIFPQKKSHYRHPNRVGITDLTAALDEWGGVQVRVDEVRVPPYGEGRNDWLQIDADRGRRAGKSEFNPVTALAEKLRGVQPQRAMLSMLSFKSYVGEVNVVAEPGFLEMKASREGFVGEGGIELLRHVVRFGIDWSTIYRDYYIRCEEKDAAAEAKQRFEDAFGDASDSNDIIQSAVDYLNREITQFTADLSSEDRDEVTETVARATDAIVQKSASQKTELRHLRLVASTSSLLLIFSHEVKALLAELDQLNVRLSKLKKSITSDAMIDVVEMQSKLSTTQKRFMDLLKLTSVFSVDHGKELKTRLALRPRIESAVDCFQLIKDTYKIEISTDEVGRAVKAGPMLDAELYSVLLNVLSNSIKSVIAKGGERRIAISAVRDGNHTVLNVRDTGMGVSKDWEGLFDPFVADPSGDFYRNLKKQINPADSYVVGTGSGLGLSIIKEIIESHHGTIAFVKARLPWRCNLEIKLP